MWSIRDFCSLKSIISTGRLATREMSKKTSKKASKAPLAEKEKDPQSGPVTPNKNGDIIIRVQAKPGAKYNSITDISDEAVGIAISAPPVEGEANTELVRYLANILDLRKSDVSMGRGSRSRHKMVMVSNTTVASVLEKLKEQIKSNS